MKRSNQAEIAITGAQTGSSRTPGSSIARFKTSATSTREDHHKMFNVPVAMMLNRNLIKLSLAALLLFTGSSFPSIAAETPSDIPNMTTDPDDMTSDPSVFESRLPNCVWVPVLDDHYILIGNECNTQQRVKVIIAWGQDSRCYPIFAHSTQDHSWRLGRFDGLRPC